MQEKRILHIGWIAAFVSFFISTTLFFAALSTYQPQASVIAAGCTTLLLGALSLSLVAILWSIIIEGKIKATRRDIKLITSCETLSHSSVLLYFRTSIKASGKAFSRKVLQSHRRQIEPMERANHFFAFEFPSNQTNRSAWRSWLVTPSTHFFHFECFLILYTNKLAVFNMISTIIFVLFTQPNADLKLVILPITRTY